MRLALLLAFVALPLMEIALLIKAGQMLGFWLTLTIVVGTAIGGSMVIRRQGFAAMTDMSGMLEEGRFPLEPVLDRILLLLAGGLLVAPGLLTDVTGLLLLARPVRHVLGRLLKARFFSASSPDTTDRQNGSGTVIDGEFRRIEEPERDIKPPSRR